MTEIPYMMTNTRAEFERVRDLAWPVTDRTAATDAEFRSRIAPFEAVDEAEESLRERLIDALDAELDSLGLSQGISSRAAYHLAQTALDVVTTPVIPAAVAAYRAAQDGGAEEAVRRVEALAVEYERTPPGTVTRDRDVALDLRAALATQAGDGAR